MFSSLTLFIYIYSLTELNYSVQFKLFVALYDFELAIIKLAFQASL